MTARDILSAQMEHLQSKYTGTGNAQTTKWDWMTQQHRDTLHSFVSHPNLLLFSSIVQNEPIEHVRSAALERMIQPCGPPPMRRSEAGAGAGMDEEEDREGFEESGTAVPEASRGSQPQPLLLPPRKRKP